MSSTAKPQTRVLTGVFWVAIVVAAIYLIVRNFGVVGNVAIALIGFGAVVLVHEFGHFIIAKLSGIYVEAFSIFMPPTLLGIRRTKSGFRVRFLPGFSSNQDTAAGPPDGSASTAELEATEYRIGVFPFGGYVKLLGQEDTGPVKQNNDPRSFANKPIRSRIAVISAGVFFNVVSAALIFMVVFLIGIELPPAVVGGIVPGSAAAEAGLMPGDTFVEIAGATKDLDFSNVLIAAALSDRGQPVPMTVRHEDGSIETKMLVAGELAGSSLREFGIFQPLSLTLAEVAQPEVLRERTSLLPGDRIVAADGTEVGHYWDLEKVVKETLAPTIRVTAERAAPGGAERVSTDLPLDWAAAKGGGDVKTDADLSHVYSMVPRLRIAAVEKAPAGSKKVAVDAGEAQGLKVGDIIVGAADVEYPTYKEIRDITVAYEGKPLSLKVLRTDANGLEQMTAVTVTPRPDAETGRVVIGFMPALDARHAIVADTIAVADGPAKLDIPRGAKIISVNDTPVSSFYDIIEQVRRWENQPVTLRYVLEGRTEGGVVLPTPRGPVAVESLLGEPLPFLPLEHLFRASGPLNAIGMGYRKTVMFIEQTYVTLKQLVSGLLSPKLLMGPVGIITFSYRIVAEQPLINYAYFLGLISATIAVLNFLPIPPFDGGLVVLMIIEKIRGAALSERAQGIVAYTGWVLVLMLLVYVTFNDIVRTFFS